MHGVNDDIITYARILYLYDHRDSDTVGLENFDISKLSCVTRRIT